MSECRVRAQEILRQGRPTNWIAASVIIAIWVLLAALAGVLVARTVGFRF
jgi:hypothetical protein